jgi:hypothetical protein
MASFLAYLAGEGKPTVEGKMRLLDSISSFYIFEDDAGGTVIGTADLIL